jgi:tetratricopeptide (TPR) repeat protein
MSPTLATAPVACRRRGIRGRWTLAGTLAIAAAVTSLPAAYAAPYIPKSADAVLTDLPAGARHISQSTRALSVSRLEIALPVAQFDIARARATGDLRYLGYAQAALAPWLRKTPVPTQVLVLDATILQSRHAFGPALDELDRALAQRPDDPQGWLTRAIVLRVLGRFDAAQASCGRLASAADPAITTLCIQSLRSLTGNLKEAYATVAALPEQALPPEARAWRFSELGEMAERRGDDAAAERWLRQGLEVAPDDLYMRAALADVLLRQQRPAETLQLLSGMDSMEPMLLRLAIAHRMLRDSLAQSSATLLGGEFALEQQRGDAVHRREQARYFLDVDPQPRAALAAALANWQVQREPDDVLVLLRAAQAAQQPDAAAPVRQFLRQQHLEDVRLRGYQGPAS